MVSDVWEEDGGKIGNKYVWKYRTFRDSELRDRKTGEDREELGVVVYRTGDDVPVAYYNVGLSYQGDGPDERQTKKEQHFIEQLQKATEKGKDIQFLKHKKLLLVDDRSEEKDKKLDSRNNMCPSGYEYVNGFHKKDGSYVKGFCRKMKK